jgi:hypothetical protein
VHASDVVVTMGCGDACTAGTKSGTELNKLFADSLAEVEIDISKQTPNPIDPEVVRSIEVGVTLGREAQVELVAGTRFENWDTDEPSQRGINGIERVRLVRDDDWGDPIGGPIAMRLGVGGSWSTVERTRLG